jgi:hypothetical protein
MEQEPPNTAATRYQGEIVYIYAYDIAYEMTDEPISAILGQPVERYSVGPSKRSPREMLFYRPLMVRLPPVERQGPGGPVDVRRTVKLFSIGSISITVCVPFLAEHSSQLVDYHDLKLNGVSLQEEARQLAEEVLRELRPRCIRPVAQVRDEEAYTIFHLNSPLTGADRRPLAAEEWLRQHRRNVAALLTQEYDMAALSEQEVEESIGHFLSYYHSDLAVIDWDAALIVAGREDFDEALHVTELANVQLAELEAYDRMLDEAMAKSYRDLRLGRSGHRDTLRNLRELRLDLARVSDELSNITKFFGDWHLARIYQKLSARFHLGDWQKTIDEKLKTLDELYAIFKQDSLNRWMMALEIGIVLLFVIDLVLLVMGLKL